MNYDSKIFVAGHTGLVGSAIVRFLATQGYKNVVTRSRTELDLTIQQAVHEFFSSEKPEYVFLAAAKVGGIKANIDFCADFIYENLMIEANVINAAHKSGVKKLLFLGSSCIYPRDCPQPIKEEYLLSSHLEPSNQSYAIAKIAGIELCKAFNTQHGTHFISCMPTNLYGPNDNFDLHTSHVFPALIRKFIEAKEMHTESVTIWGSGRPMREFLHVDDLANAAVFLMHHHDGSEIVNIGSGKDISILELAEMIKQEVGYEGKIVFDSSKPDGTPKKLLDISKIEKMGWKPNITLEQGIRDTVQWYKDNK